MEMELFEMGIGYHTEEVRAAFILFVLSVASYYTLGSRIKVARQWEI